MSAVIFPFTAIVGQSRMKRALILNAINPQIGGVLIRGEKGTAKSTAARALAALLPQIEVIEGCAFNLAPSTPREDLSSLCGPEQPTVMRQIKLVDLPVSATEDRVVGTLDIEKAIQKGERHFEPGILASANRGILYVDEVNLLDDHIVDLLLDSAAMGVNIVEREGISVTHPARFMLIGTMNPEEGDLRPQLLDRFALCVDVQGIHDPAQRMLILERHIQFEQDPDTFRGEWLPFEQNLSEEIERARSILADVGYSRFDLATIANLTANMAVDGHRADLVILKAARAHAAFEGRDAINEHDILMAAELALPHRLKRSPFQEAYISAEQLGDRLSQAREEAAETTAASEDADGSEAAEDDAKKKIHQK